MGRTVDLHHLVSQKINSTLLRSLDVAISRFETLGFTSVVVSISHRFYISDDVILYMLYVHLLVVTESDGQQSVIVSTSLTT